MDAGTGDLLSGFFGQALVLAAALTRVAAAFLVSPLLAPDLVPPLVRNSLFVGMSLIVIALQPDLILMRLTASQWTALLVREAFVGLVMGFLFSTVLWALASAGRIIDAKAGTTVAQIIDPLSGEGTSLHGAFLSSLATFVFVSSGGLLLLVGSLLTSYAVVPFSASPLRLSPGSVGLFETEFARLSGLAVVFAAPSLVILSCVEAGLGVINRFAQQLNVFSLSASIKAWLSSVIVLATLSLFSEAIVAATTARPHAAFDAIRAVAHAPSSRTTGSPD